MAAVVNRWIGRLFARENLDATVAEVLGSQEGAAPSNGRDTAKQRLSTAEAQLARFQDAIKAGVDPAAPVEVINAAPAERQSARAELVGAKHVGKRSAAEIHAMIDSLGDVGAKLKAGKPERLAQLYADLRLELRYEKAEEAVYATASLRVFNERDRGASCSLTTRLALPGPN